MPLPARGPSICCLALLVLAACPDGGGDTDVTTGVADTDGATDTGAVTGDPTTSVDETTGADCPNTGAPASFYYNLGGPLPGSPASVAWDCTVDEVAGGCDEWRVTLACSEGGMVLDEAARLDLMLAPAAGSLPFTVGMAVKLRYMEARPFWIESAIRVEAADGTLLLAGARGSGDLDPFSPQDVGRGALVGRRPTSAGRVDTMRLRSTSAARRRVRSSRRATVSSERMRCGPSPRTRWPSPTSATTCPGPGRRFWSTAHRGLRRPISAADRPSPTEPTT